MFPMLDMPFLGALSTYAAVRTLYVFVALALVLVVRAPTGQSAAGRRS